MRNISKIWKLAAGAGLGLILQVGASAGGERGCYGNCYEQVPAPVMHRTFLRRVTTDPGAYEIDREPSVYGLATRRELVDDGGEWRERPAKRILVSRAHGSRLRSAPVYNYVQKRILLRPYKNIAIYHRARRHYVRERIAIQPESFIWESASGGPAYR
jgi:hypothetical protein